MKQINPVKVIEAVIFNVRWLLIPFYLGLVVILGLFLISFCRETWDTAVQVLFHPAPNDSEVLEMTILTFVDKGMMANLIKMIITGSYNSFVNKKHGFPNENISSGILKVKMGTSVMFVSLIHLLQVYLSDKPAAWDTLLKLLAMFSIFIVAALVMMIIEYLHVKTEKIEHDMEEHKAPVVESKPPETKPNLVGHTHSMEHHI